MAREPLEALLEIRRIALDEARLELAACLEDEVTAARLIVRCDDALVAEQRAAERLAADDAAVEALAAWLPSAQRRTVSARSDHERAMAKSAGARAAATLARGGYEAVQEVLLARLVGASRVRMHREQLDLEDATRRSARCGPGNPY